MFVDVDGLTVVLETKKEGTSMHKFDKDLNKTIGQIKEELSKKTEAKHLTVWGIQYQNKEYNLEINESKALEYYTSKNKNIQYIFAKESDDVDFNILKILGSLGNDTN